MPKVVINGIAVLVIAAVAVGAGWWFFIREDAEPKTNSQVITDDLKTAVATAAAKSTAVTAATRPAEETPASPGGLAFEIIPEQSEATYLAGETLASVGLPSTAQGETKEIAGAIFLTADGFDLDPTNETKFTVQLASLKTDQDRRDNRVREALEVVKFPIATFVATAVSGVDQSLPIEQEHAFQMTGLMTLHGVEKEVMWEVKARREGDILTALATITILYADFGITKPDIGGFVSVEDDVTLQMDIVATQAP
jgi:polyisoprenoid-binding protein YceI